MAADLPRSDSEIWQGRGSFSQTNLRMIDDEVLCDLTFLAGELEEPVRAHKFMVVSRSPVFYAMFCGPVADKQDTVVIPDIDASTIRSLLRYIYTEDCIVCWDNVYNILYAASKYLVDGLLKKCSDFLQTNISIEKVCDVLNQALMFSLIKLTGCCRELILKNTKKALHSTGFIYLTPSALKLTISEAKLTIDEVDIYCACVKWASFNCKANGNEASNENIREYLGDILGYISFLDMPIDIFSSRVAVNNILTSDEKVYIFRSIAEGTSDIDSVTSSPYITLWQQRSEKLIERFSKLNKSWRQHNKTDAVSFLCNKSMILGGVSLYTPSSPGETHGSLDILENNTVKYSSEVNLSFDQNTRSERIRVRPRIRLVKNVIYTIRQKLKGESTYYGSVVKCSDQSGSPILTFIKGISDNGTSDSEGQIHGLFIAEPI